VFLVNKRLSYYNGHYFNRTISSPTGLKQKHQYTSGVMWVGTAHHHHKCWSKTVQRGIVCRDLALCDVLLYCHMYILYSIKTTYNPRRLCLSIKY